MKSSLFNFWHYQTSHNNYSERKIKSFVLNFGPQHPASHGVLRVVLQLSGELIEKVDPHVGFLHRGTEKLIEKRAYLQGVPYFDRLDYVSMMTQEHAFCLSIESLLNTTSTTALYVQIRVMFDELTRIMNHLLALACHSLDVGNMSPLFWAFEERERLMEFYERVSGARMHAAFYRPNELDWTGLNYQLFLDISLFCRNCFKSLTEIFAVLTTHNIWKTRLISVGNLNINDALNYGVSGPVIRSIGVKKDLRFRKSDTYASYWYLSMHSFLGKKGDSYDRFLIRIREMYESVNIVFQVLANISNINKKPSHHSNKVNYFDFFDYLYKIRYNKLLKKTKHTSMESLINHFKKYSEGLKIPRGFTYQAVEAPKGEFGVSLVSDGTTKPYRCKIRTPSYHHTHIMSRSVQGHYMADLVTIIGSQDVVFGDVDR